jgi:class 3 adenylate cyclase
MPKLSVVELKALIKKAETDEAEHVVIQAGPTEQTISRERSDSVASSRVSSATPHKPDKKTLAKKTKELTTLYRVAISHTEDGKLNFNDIKELVTAFAHAEPTNAQMVEIMKELDEDGDGDVTEEEWLSFGLKHMTADDDHNDDDHNHDETDLLLSNDRELSNGGYKNRTKLQKISDWWSNIDWEELYWSCKDNTAWFLESCKMSVSFGDLMMMMTLFVLFGDSIRLLAAPKDADEGFEVCNTICLFFFVGEFLGQWWAKTDFESFWPLVYDGYFNSFYFWLDFVSILSMFPDIPWISNAIGLGDVSSAVQGNNSITRAGRIIRLVRLVRLVRLYKIYLDKKRKMEQEREMTKLLHAGDMSYDDILRQQALYQDRQSKLGSKLNHSITQRVIILVLTMVIILPLCTYTQSNYSANTAIDTLFTFVADPNSSASPELKSSLFENVKKSFSSTQKANPVLIYLDISTNNANPAINKINFINKRNDLRDSAKVYIKQKSMSGYYVEAEFDNNALLMDGSRLKIGLTIFIGLCLILGSAVFNDDAQQTVLSPIERMMNMLEQVVKDPLSPLYFDHSAPPGPGEYETRLLESTVEKITGLLRVGFGEAGAGIISANLSLDSGSKINPLLPGVRVYVIVGFCDIHHFEEVLVKLTDDVLTFVNHIAEIVHENVAHWGGQCNKNLGNAFVILWRIDDEDRLNEVLNTSKFSKKVTNGPETSKKKEKRDSGTSSQKAKQVIDLKRVPGINIFADQALIGYLKIIAEINRSKDILKYRNEPRLTSNGTEVFKVSMGFGLHAGWAIEGAVGSMYKVDATYLSPHVNMAARLETSSRQYGVPVLISHFVQELLSQAVKDKCRLIDVVTVKGSEVPVGVYTYDCLMDQTFKAKPQKDLKKKDTEAKKLQKENAKAKGVGESELTGDVLVNKISSSSSIIGGRSNFQTMAPIDLDFADGFLADPNQDTGMKHKGHKGKNNQNNINKNQVDDEDNAVEGFFLNNTHDTVEVFDMDDDLLMLRAHVANNDEFNSAFNEGIKIYLDGDWPNAHKLLTKANKIMVRILPSSGGDGPCLTLLKYMEERNKQAPPEWAGFRPLTAK